MKLFSRNAEELLFNKAKTIREQHLGWRCIHIDFKSHKDQCSEGLRTNIVTNIIKELLAWEVGYIYLCEDGDVFILFQGKIKDLIDQLGEYFRDLGAIKGAEGKSLYSTLDLSVDWEAFYGLCEEKHVARKPVQQVPDLQNNGPSYKPLSELDTTLFHAADAQRGQRKRLLVEVVEDDPFTRRLVAGALRSHFDVVEAGEGGEALKVYTNRQRQI